VKFKITLLLIILLSLWVAFAICKPDNISEEDSKNPLAGFKFRSLFYGISGNITKAGLTKDLEAIERVGIGGILLFNISQGIPNKPIKYNSPEHHEMLKYAAAECERLGLTFGVHNCESGSSSGGLWITPEQSMKMVVWSKTISEGREVDLKLSQLSTREDLYKADNPFMLSGLIEPIQILNTKIFVNENIE
jgi:hypothetical protein